MNRSISTFSAAAAALALVAFAPGAFASDQGPNTAPLAQLPTAGTSQKPMTVYDLSEVPFPVQVQIVKQMLNRSWSSDASDNRMRCRFQTQAGSRFKVLWCQSNSNNSLRIAGKAQGPCSRTFVTSTMTFQGDVASDCNANHPELRAASLENVLKKIPDSGSYILRVTGGGKPETDYVMQGGQLVEIIKHEYVMKDGKRVEVLRHEKVGPANPI